MTIIPDSIEHPEEKEDLEAPPMEDSDIVSSEIHNTNDINENGSTRNNGQVDEKVSLPGILIPMDQLPPLPTPQDRTIREQRLGGICMILFIIGTLVGLTHGIALSGIGFDKHSVPWYIFLVLIYSQAGVALLCLTAIEVLVDPGVVPRNAETCYPIPHEMNTWLTTNKDRPSVLYISSQDEHHSKDTYCTRCLVWRRMEHDHTDKTHGENVATKTTTTTTASSSGIKYFHCNVCQRCVKHHDHHCDFLGRCIAGPTNFKTPSGGNIKYFYGLITVAATSYLTCLSAVLGALIHSYDTRWVVPIFLMGVIVLHCMFPCFQGVLGGLKRFLCRAY